MASCPDGVSHTWEFTTSPGLGRHIHGDVCPWGDHRLFGRRLEPAEIDRVLEKVGKATARCGISPSELHNGWSCR
jgi:hypothetical protein